LFIHWFKSSCCLNWFQSCIASINQYWLVTLHGWTKHCGRGKINPVTNSMLSVDSKYSFKWRRLRTQQPSFILFRAYTIAAEFSRHRLMIAEVVSLGSSTFWRVESTFRRHVTPLGRCWFVPGILSPLNKLESRNTAILCIDSENRVTPCLNHLPAYRYYIVITLRTSSQFCDVIYQGGARPGRNCGVQWRKWFKAILVKLNPGKSPGPDVLHPIVLRVFA